MNLLILSDDFNLFIEYDATVCPVWKVECLLGERVVTVLPVFTLHV